MTKTLRFNGQIINSSGGAKFEQYNEVLEKWEPFEGTEEGDIVSNKTMNGYVSQEISNAKNDVSIDVLNPIPAVPGESFLVALTDDKDSELTLPTIPVLNEIIVSDYTTTGYIQVNKFGTVSKDIDESYLFVSSVDSPGSRIIVNNVNIAVPGEKIKTFNAFDPNINYILISITVVE